MGTASHSPLPLSPENGGPSLMAVDLPSCKQKKLDIKWMGVDNEIIGLAPYKDGKILIAKKNTLYWFNPAKGVADRFYVPKDIADVTEVAYDTANDIILLNSREKLYILPKGQDQFSEVVTRRVPGLEGISFTPNGTIVFGYEGDLWHAKVVGEEDEIEGKKTTRYSLFGYRYAPLATLETANSTPSQEGAR